MPVNTVNGPIRASELGVTTPHEHLFLDLTNFFEEPATDEARRFAHKKIEMRDLGVLSRDPFVIRDNMLLDDEAVQTAEMRAFRDAGGRTAVDVTLPGMGRDVRALRRLADATGLQIVAGTGYYVRSAHPAFVADATVGAVEAAILGEIRDGIDGTDIRPGIIGEIGISDVIFPDEAKVLRAAARAQKESGLPLMIHINPWSKNGLPALDLIRDEGVAPERICICHVDVQNDRDYISKLLDRGVFIEFDNFGKQFTVDSANVRPSFGRFATDTERVLLVKELLDRGYGAQLLVSCDICLKNLLHEYGGWGYDHILARIVPEMLERGITREQIDTLLVGNPARYLNTEE